MKKSTIFLKQNYHECTLFLHGCQDAGNGKMQLLEDRCPVFYRQVLSYWEIQNISASGMSFS